MTKLKDTDYLALSSRIKAMENGLLSRDRMEHMLDARSPEEIAKILQECGYAELGDHPEKLDEVISQAREAVFEDLFSSAPDTRFVELFKLKYDYHNVKVLLKAEAMEKDPANMLMDMGRVPVAELQEAILTKESSALPAALATAIAEARDILGTTGDPQLSDIALDRAYFAELLTLAEETGSEFLQGYVRILADAANLRSLVRTLRMGKGADFLRAVLIPGGNVGVDALLVVSAAGGSGLAEIYGAGELETAAAVGASVLAGGPLTRFEKLCDDVVGDYLADGKFVPFGEAPLVGYLAAKETEYTNLRVLILGRSMHLPTETIRERLREAYV